MVEQATSAAPPLIRAFAMLHRHAMGMAVGVALGTTIFFATLASLRSDPHPAQHLGLLAQFLAGYSVSPTGAVVGLVWGFVLGYVLGWSFALLRNLLVRLYVARLRMRADMEQYGDFIDHM